jgi:hypothetical protein
MACSSVDIYACGQPSSELGYLGPIDGRGTQPEDARGRYLSSRFGLFGPAEKVLPAMEHSGVTIAVGVGRRLNLDQETDDCRRQREKRAGEPQSDRPRAWPSPTR